MVYRTKTPEEDNILAHIDGKIESYKRRANDDYENRDEYHTAAQTLGVLRGDIVNDFHMPEEPADEA